MADESGKHSGSMSAFVPFFISSATFSYVSTGNLDLLILICVVPQHPSLSFLFNQEIGPLPPPFAIHHAFFVFSTKRQVG